MVIVYAKDYTNEAVQKLLKSGAEVRNPQFFKGDCDTKAEKVHIFGDYPQIAKAFKCEVIRHEIKAKPSKGEPGSTPKQSDQNDGIPSELKVEDSEERVEQSDSEAEGKREATEEVGETEEQEGADSEEEQEEPEDVPELEYPHHKGSGYYLLSNGDTVRGKKAAQNAQKSLSENGG